MSATPEKTTEIPGINSRRRDFVKGAGLGLGALGLLATAPQAALAARPGADNFYKSHRVNISKVNFNSQFSMRVVGNLVAPKNLSGKAAAIIVGHPMGAVKEQSSMLYAQKLAEQGFVTLAIDLPYWGESDGQPRNLVAPDIYVDAFSAAADYLTTRDDIDAERVGVLGICGSGGFAVGAAKLDPRLKAIATVSMYDMGAVTRHGLKHSLSSSQREAMLAKAAGQREDEFRSGKGIFLNYLPVQLPADADPVTREFWDFYRTPRGAYVPAGQTLEQTQNRMLSSEIRFVNFYPFNDIETISPRPLLFISGDQAHSREFSEAAYQLASEPKALHWVAGAGHVDLYDRADLIPWKVLATFFQRHLNA